MIQNINFYYLLTSLQFIYSMNLITFKAMHREH